MAYAAVRNGTPRWIRPLLTTFSGVAANFAGVPLAFAFIATIGFTGIVTKFLNDHAGVNIYHHGFTLFSFTGVAIVYLYFQIPLMILVIAPAIDGLRRGVARGVVEPRRELVPVLAPHRLPGAAAVACSAPRSCSSATPSLRTPPHPQRGGVSIVPVIIGQNIGGDVLSNPHLSQALAFGMIVVIAASMVLYALVQRRSSRWMR